MAHIPSTQSLRIFRKAAEALSFSQSAEELYLTQSAVSQQIRQLEEQLRTPLFVRHRRGIRLSDAGQQFLQSVAPILDELEASVSLLQRGYVCTRIVARVDSALLASRLLPNLSKLLSSAADLEIQFEASDCMPKSFAEDHAVAVYLGTEIKDPDVCCTRIASEQVFAVCSPSLVAQHPICSLDDLSHHPLLLVQGDKHDSDWCRWLTPDEHSLLDGRPHAIFRSRALALSAALAGQGISLAGSIPARPYLSAGTLVQPLARCGECTDSYYFACPKSLLEVPSIESLRDWVVACTAVTDQPTSRKELLAAA